MSSINQKIFNRIALCLAPHEELSKEDQKQQLKTFAIAQEVLAGLEEQVRKASPGSSEQRRAALCLAIGKTMMKDLGASALLKNYSPNFFEKGKVACVAFLVLQKAQTFCQDKDELNREEFTQEIGEAITCVAEVLAKQGSEGEKSVVTETKFNRLSTCQEKTLAILQTMIVTPG